MIHPNTFETLDRLVSSLPFHLDDIDKANDLFDSWRISGQREERKIVDLWTYCFVWRSILVKFARDPDLNPSDFDMLVAHIFERVLDRRHTIRESGRYAHWTSVVCRNLFVNHVRLRKKDVHFEEEADTKNYVSEPKESGCDAVILHQMLVQAISRLPGYLQEIARLKLVDEMSYEEISTLVGKKVEVIRSYVSKSNRRLREDRQLSAFLRNEFCEDTEKRGM